MPEGCGGSRGSGGLHCADGRPPRAARQPRATWLGRMSVPDAQALGLGRIRASASIGRGHPRTEFGLLVAKASVRRASSRSVRLPATFVPTLRARPGVTVARTLNLSPDRFHSQRRYGRPPGLLRPGRAADRLGRARITPPSVSSQTPEAAPATLRPLPVESVNRRPILPRRRSIRSPRLATEGRPGGPRVRGILRRPPGVLPGQRPGPR